jgi:hypothetical protein
MTTHMQTTIICPQTQTALAIELPADEQGLASYWTKPVVVQCPVCRATHVNAYGELYMRGTMAPFQCTAGPVLLN